MTVPPKPNGLPIATTQSPTRASPSSPKASQGADPPFSILSTARSVRASRPTTRASCRAPSCRVTVTSVASATTWSLVTMWPSPSTKKPEPTCTRGSGRVGIRSKNRSNGAMSSHGGRGSRAAAAVGFSTVTNTTAGWTRSARSANPVGDGAASSPMGPERDADEPFPTAADSAAPSTTAPASAPAVTRAIAPRCGMRVGSFMAALPPAEWFGPNPPALAGEGRHPTPSSFTAPLPDRYGPAMFAQPARPDPDG